MSLHTLRSIKESFLSISEGIYGSQYTVENLYSVKMCLCSSHLNLMHLITNVVQVLKRSIVGTNSTKSKCMRHTICQFYGSILLAWFCSSCTCVVAVEVVLLLDPHIC